MSATVIIPTTGAPELRTAIVSVLDQSYDTTCYVVVDGEQYFGKTRAIVSDYAGNKNLKVCYLPINVGSNGFYGHRVYASFTHLVDTEYVLYLDQDCWFDEHHVLSCIETIQNNNLEWCYSLRKIYDKDSKYICNDDCESLGKYQSYHGINHIDTNSYCLSTKIAIRLASVWHGGWGQDRVFLSAISQHFQKYDCTGLYTSNYRVDGNQGSVTGDFFLNGNKIMNEKYKGKYPWQKI
jgi:GT2 family glycosyltransferase